MDLRYGDYYRRLHSILERLEYWAEPSPPFYVAPSTALGVTTSFLTSGIVATMPVGLRAPETRPLLETVTSQLEVLEKEATVLVLARTKKRIERARSYLESLRPEIVNQMGDANLKTEIRVLREALEDDLEDRLVFFPSDIRVKAWLGDTPFGDTVYTAFPSQSPIFRGRSTPSLRTTGPHVCST